MSESHQSSSLNQQWNPFGAPSSYYNNGTPSMDIYYPDRHTMEARWRFRDQILQETADHRRIHPQHGGIGHTGRNIVHVLYDRERKGVRAIRHRRNRRGVGGLGFSSAVSTGDKSPATVFDSPNSTTQTNLYEAAVAMPVPDNTNSKGATPDSMASADNKSIASSADSPQHDPTLRRVVYPKPIAHEIRFFAEYSSTVRYHSAFLNHLGGDDERDDQGNRPESSKAVSTISVAFSPDSQTMASTHGDHTVKISSCNTGRLLQSLDGHPRTPWTVKYHPFDPDVIASGCLGHQVRIWNWVEKSCLQMVRLDFAIISVSFHPSGKLLAVANGTRLNLWGVHPKKRNEAAGVERSHENNNNDARHRSAVLTEIEQRHMLRCVHFPPSGEAIIIGGVNPPSEDPRRRHRSGIGGGGMTFYLRLWDFDLNLALKPPVDLPVGLPAIRRAISNVCFSFSVISCSYCSKSLFLIILFFFSAPNLCASRAAVQ